MCSSLPITDQLKDPSLPHKLGDGINILCRHSGDGLVKGYVSADFGSRPLFRGQKTGIILKSTI